MTYIKKRLLCSTVACVLALSASLPVVCAADWPQFLGIPTSQGASNAPTPKDGDSIGLRWEQLTGTLGEDGTITHTWDDVPGTPIIVGDVVYYYSSQYLRKMDLTTGQELATALVYGKPVNQFFIDIAYGQGKIFVPCQINNLDDGLDVDDCFFRVYDAETLEQLYVTQTMTSGQMQSPVMYYDGYFVTGTYGKNGVYACFTATDEDPTVPDEIKEVTWQIQSDSKYGFSFNGATFVGDYCYFGGSDLLYIVNYKTGTYQTMSIGEGYSIHSTITYSAETDRLYVASNHPTSGASIFAYSLGSNGMPDLTTTKEWVSGTEGGGTQSTPVVYNGRLYLGGGGHTMGSAEPFHVIDAITMEEIYAVPILTKGSAAISTAYATEDNGNTVYLYLVPYAPTAEKVSQLWIVTDKEGQTTPDYSVVENIGHGQYCSQSIAIGQDGSLLWYNDAARIYCYEPLTAGDFIDTKGHWAEESIRFLAEKNIVSGTGDKMFSPNASITRAAYVQMLANFSGEDFSTYTTNQFTDVLDTDWFSPAVAWAVSNGITTGSSANTFSPQAQITRQDMTAMLHRYLTNIANITLEPTEEAIAFTDETAIAPYASTAVSSMQQAGVLHGNEKYDAYYFSPMEEATRGQVATILATLYPQIHQ